MSNDKEQTQDPQEQAAQEPAEQPAAPPDDESTGHQGPVDPQAAIEAERDELYARLQRVSADYQNYMRRSAQNLEDGVELARGDLLRQLVPVLDHFDNALAAAPEAAEAKSLHDGLRIVRDELLKVLRDNGVQRIEPEVGEPFNPEQHEAMLRQPADGVAPNHVTVTMQPGYVYGKRTLRAAKVAVAPEE